MTPAALKAAVRRELAADGATYDDLGQYLGITERHVADVLSGRVAAEPELLAAMAAACGLEGETR